MYNIIKLIKRKEYLIMKEMSRRTFFGSGIAAGGALSLGNISGCGAPSPEKPASKAITRTYPLDGYERENIRITDVKATVLSYEMPDPKDYWHTADYFCWKNDEILVEIFTDQGIVGIGGASQYGGIDRVPKYIDEFVKPALIGKNPFDIFVINCGSNNFMKSCAWSGVDVALWDIIGKAKNMPVYKMLATDNEPDPHIRCYASYGVNWKFYDHPETLIDDGIRYKEEGYTAYKIRKGTDWAYSDMTIKKYVPFLYKLREAVGYDMEIMQETMMGSGHTTEEVAEQLCPVLDELKIHWFEQPVGHWRYDPEDIPEYRKMLYDKRASQCYTDELRQRLGQQARQHGLSGKMRLCF